MTTDMEEMVENIQQLCLYMELNDISLEFEESYVNYDRTKHHLIDGFTSPKPIQAAQIILPAPNKGYLGIKPAILIVNSPEIIQKVTE
jgi:hypothetical protein